MSFIIKKGFGIILLAALLLSGCGFQMQNKTDVPEQFKTMTFYSIDPYSFLSREIKSALTNNGVTLVAEQEAQTVPSLRITSYNVSKSTVSVFQDGKAAEYQLILTVQAQVVIAEQDIFPISVKVFRSFFDNPAAALAKDTEQTLIQREMYKQAADQLVRKLKSVNAAEQKLHSA